MTIVDKIKNVVEGATGLKFHYDTPQTLNVTLDTTTYPCIFANVLSSGTALDKGGSVHEQVTIEFVFSNLCDVDFDGIKAEHIIDGLKKSAFKMLLNFYKSDTLRVVRNDGTRRYYANKDVVLCGFGIVLQLEEIQGITLCS